MSATAVATGSGSGWALPRFMTAEHPLPWLLPITAMLTVFGLYPLGYSIWLSLHKRNVLTRQLDFAGGYQWMRAFADQRMWGALETTLIYTLVALAAQLVLGLLIALLLDTDRRGYGVLRALMTLPLVVPPAVTGMMFLLMQDGSFGVLSFDLYALDLVSPAAPAPDPAAHGAAGHHAGRHLAMDAVHGADHAGRAAFAAEGSVRGRRHRRRHRDADLLQAYAADAAQGDRGGGADPRRRPLPHLRLRLRHHRRRAGHGDRVALLLCRTHLLQPATSPMPRPCR